MNSSKESLWDVAAAFLMVVLISWLLTSGGVIIERALLLITRLVGRMIDFLRFCRTAPEVLLGLGLGLCSMRV